MTSLALAASGTRKSTWRPSILDGYLLRLLAMPALGVLGVTLVAFLLDQTLRLITQLEANGAHMGYLFGLVTNLVPYQLGLALPASFCVAMFIVIARLGDDSELDAILAGGVSFERIAAPLVFVGIILGAVSLLLAGYLQPYSRFGYRAVLNAATQAGWTAQLDPQVFINAGPDFTITSDEVDATGRQLKGVFIRRTTPNGDMIVTAEHGSLSLQPDRKTTDLDLTGGLILSDTPHGVRLLRFADFNDRQLLSNHSTLAPRGGDAQELTIPELIREMHRPDALIPKRVLEAELYSRLARSFGVPFLPLLALPLAMAVKRGRRAPGMIVGAIVLVAFHHGVTLCESFADSGEVDPLLAIGGLFLALAGFGVWLFMSSRRRPGETPLSGLFRRMEFLFERRPKARASAMRVRGSLGISAYLTRIMAVRTLAATVALIGLLQLIDLLERTNDILARGGAIEILRYMALRLPYLFEQVAPFAVLAGALFTFSQLARNSELVVMRISGLSLLQIFRRTLPVALAVAVLDLVVADQVTPRAEQALATWWAASAPGSAAHASAPRWFRIDGNVVLVRAAAPSGRVLRGVSIYDRDAQKQLYRRIVAQTATWDGREWRLADATVTDLRQDHADSMTVGTMDWPTTLRPSDTARLFAGSYEMTSEAAYRSLFGKGPVNQSPSEFQTRLYRTLAEAMAPIIMLLLALPTALGYARSNRTIPVIFGLCFGLLYLVADGVLTAMGETGVLPPWAAAWGAPVAFAAGAVTYLLYAEG
ncbi:MAG: LPS export ABC transporter permease LptG [Caulobacteraceae bacterium]